MRKNISVAKLQNATATVVNTSEFYFNNLLCKQTEMVITLDGNSSAIYGKLCIKFPLL